MIQLSPETEALIHARAAATGRTPDDVVREALGPLAASVSAASGTIEERARALDLIVKRLASLPVRDARSADEIIGFDDHGVPS